MKRNRDALFDYCLEIGDHYIFYHDRQATDAEFFRRSTLCSAGVI